MRSHLVDDLEKFDWDMIQVSSIFVDFKEVHRRLAELVMTYLSPEDQNILIDGNDEQSLSDQAMPFYSAFTVSQANLQVRPIVEAEDS